MRGAQYMYGYPTTLGTSLVQDSGERYCVYNPVGRFYTYGESWSVSPFRRKNLSHPDAVTYVMAYLGSKKDLVGVQPRHKPIADGCHHAAVPSVS